jgi:hypothetical protein
MPHSKKGVRLSLSYARGWRVYPDANGNTLALHRSDIFLGLQIFGHSFVIEDVSRKCKEYPRLAAAAEQLLSINEPL